MLADAQPHHDAPAARRSPFARVEEPLRRLEVRREDLDPGDLLDLNSLQRVRDTVDEDHRTALQVRAQEAQERRRCSSGDRRRIVEPAEADALPLEEAAARE